MKKKSSSKNVLRILTALLLLFILFSQNTNAQTQLLDSLSLDTLTAFTSMEEAMKNPEQVIKLELRKKRLKKFPPEIFKFINLQYLDLSKNDIGELPSEIGQLKNLQYLAISRSGLQEFPTQIGDLTNLYYLEANNNDLTSLPTEIGKLEKLKTFDLWSNDIDKFPTELRNLKSLKLFDLRVIMIPDAEQARVQSLLPHTKIFFSPYCKCEQ
ncbi:MAG: leucine-rich repeat domain-containing protein [Bacteroidia bacterium]|nr:leucine-rich repeat domain-containing protein [Bacteroidia bacterium]